MQLDTTEKEHQTRQELKSRFEFERSKLLEQHAGELKELEIRVAEELQQ